MQLCAIKKIKNTSLCGFQGLCECKNHHGGGIWSQGVIKGNHMKRGTREKKRQEEDEEQEENEEKPPRRITLKGPLVFWPPFLLPSSNRGVP